MHRGWLLGSRAAVIRNVRVTVCVAFLPVAAVSLPAVSPPAVALPAVAAQEDTEDNVMFWSTTLKMIRAKYPEVAQLSTDSLQTMLDASLKAERPLLLDVREKKNTG